MNASRSGLRALEAHSPHGPGDPSFVLYRLDPVTLDFSEVRGNPEQLLGFPEHDWYAARFWSGRLHPEDREAVRAFFERLASSRRDEQLQYRVIDAEGQTLWVHQIVSVERKAQEEVSLRGVLIDVTEQVAREADIERALFMNAELFRIIAEELAPPVRAISVYGDMLGRHLAAQGDDVGSDYAVGLREVLESLDTMLGQLMRAAQAGGGPLQDAAASATLASRRGPHR